MRGYAASVAVDGTVLTVVGEDSRDVELLVPSADADRRRVDRACQQVLATRGAWLTAVTHDARRLADQVAEHGLRVLAHAECLMTVALVEHAHPAPPDGYELALDVEPHALRVRVTAPDGSVAATGQAGLLDGWCVPDRVLVRSAHRRRGLGAAVMGSLTSQARHHAAGGLLVASPEGRRLYERLGWSRVADVLSADHG